MEQNANIMVAFGQFFFNPHDRNISSNVLQNLETLKCNVPFNPARYIRIIDVMSEVNCVLQRGALKTAFQFCPARCIRTFVIEFSKKSSGSFLPFFRGKKLFFHGWRPFRKLSSLFD